MKIDQINLYHFRNYESLQFSPDEGVNLLYGSNGSGKTNILEAIHYCALGRSHRTNSDRDVILQDQDTGACGVKVTKEHGQVDIATKFYKNEHQSKQYFIQRKKVSRSSDLMGNLNIVIFSPEDLMLIREGPQLRRRYLDMMISQVNSSYYLSLQNYQKALMQRNALLKESKKNNIQLNDLYESFENQIAISSSIIIPERRKMIQRIQNISKDIYINISRTNFECFDLSYSSCCDADNDQIEKKIQNQLYQDREMDIMRGFTSHGVHREDILIRLNGKDMKLFASQGQMRTAALSMKLAQIQIFYDITKEYPVLLLDDVMSELDMTRRTQLIDSFKHLQTFITCTDESDFDSDIKRAVFHVIKNEQQLGYLDIHAEIKKNDKSEYVDEPDFS
ncbi:MAG: DNA replication/repair protein RecF [Clostridia bacterium]|nr:DNA replication/repair protein RecF [Clostridia bacterium]